MSYCVTCNGMASLMACPCCRPEPEVPWEQVEDVAQEIFKKLKAGELSRQEIHFEIDGDLSDYQDQIEEVVDELLEEERDERQRE